ncbi:class I SAM-dependent methyltransferase [Alphaproteobacteria bacterium]|nr:class I SAM-dependent methyltransferase [Alphaproteobacteria bacterium]
MENRKDNWLNIWKEKGIKLNSAKINDIIKANGFDSSLGKFTASNWYEYINDNLRFIKFKRTSEILEYGCGAGAFLSYWYNKNHNLYGIDYSKTLINKAKKIFPKVEFKKGEISTIKKFNTKFDLIFSHSVFHYFNDYNYAEDLIYSMISNLKDDGYLLILDIPDKAKEKVYKKKIKSVIGSLEFKIKYLHHSHLFYEKSFFKNLAMKYNLKVKIFNQNYKAYTNSKFRYNVLLSKLS